MKYVIEHESRGVYTHTDNNGKPRFKWSVLRSEGAIFTTEISARDRLHGIRMHKGCKGVYIVGMEGSKKPKIIRPPML